MLVSLRSAIQTIGGIIMAGALALGGEGQPAADAPAAGQEPIKVQAPFDAIFTGRRHVDRVNAFRDLLPRAGELAGAARAEAVRLRALAAPKEGSFARSAFDFTLKSLDALAAEPEAVKSWKTGLPASAGKVAAKVVNLDCTDRPIAEVLARAAAGWGVAIELSPAATQTAAALDVSLEGAPNLKEFLEWLCGEQGLVYGCSGDRIVLALPESVKLRDNLEKAGRSTSP